MIRIIDLIDNKIVIAPECLVIEPFKTIWESDKTKDKSIANNCIKYIWFYSAFNSPYFSQNDVERHNLIVEYVLSDKKFKVTKDIEKGIESFNKAYSTPSMKLFRTLQESISKMEIFFTEVEYDADNIAKIQKAIIDMPKMQEAIQTALENCRKEQTGSSKVRGDATLGLFE